MHIYLPHSLHTSFLVDSVQRCVKESNLQNQFFFLRYWQGGPHLRLRVQLEPGGGAVFERLRERIESSLPKFSEEEREEYHYGMALQDELARLENERSLEAQEIGAVKTTPYFPEFRKYGGNRGIEVAERVFRSTSVAVLELLATRAAGGRSSLSAPIGEAAQIMVMFLRGAGFSQEASVPFLASYEDWWRPYAPEAVQQSWPQIYEQVAPQLKQLCSSTWAERDLKDRFYVSSYEAAEQARSIAGMPSGGDVREVLLDGTPFSGCLSNYIHTTNNRLGLVPAGEGLVAYLVRKALEDSAS